MTEELKAAALRTQLQEVNKRAQAYTTRLWQLPFAYFAIGGFIFGVGDGGSVEVPRILAGAFGGFGILLFLHMLALQDGNNRAVKEIRECESELQGLEPTAMTESDMRKYACEEESGISGLVMWIRSSLYFWPLALGVLLVGILALVAFVLV